MTSFNIRPEDAGIRNLRNERLKPRTTEAVGEVPPYPKVHPTKVGLHEAVEREVNALQQSEENEPHQESTAEEDKAERRRPRDRRKQQTAILLDTRSGSERRLLENNPLAELNDDPDYERKGLGIDLYT